MKKLLLSLITVGIIATGCTNTSEPETTAADATPDAAESADATMPEMEGMESTSEGNVEISLVSPHDSVPMGDTEMILEVKDAATGEPVTTDSLKVDVSMAMEGMEPMMTETTVSPGAEPGLYEVQTYLSMEGPWAINAAVDEGEKAGTAHFMLEAQ
ncbi:FixH family protein [Romeria aff. gracilis LEGE 07310]|uniref:FixH family protein n=1 Tax=Vasconcelosia minhoensis LEGE 07310 TaxID=915328 RepID=A0A8J7AFP0_9CYAN|nr:FixH family protein [Romeria gracilis]MBE9078104.1 FixH family protein [Romeria aff. gracilis LEGE 07310]